MTSSTCPVCGRPDVPLLSGVSISKTYRKRNSSAPIVALNDASICVHEGERVGLAGESGCGKSTLSRMLVQLEAPDEGEVLFRGSPVTHLGSRALRQFRQAVQMVFQDPFASLNPRMNIAQLIGEAWDIHGRGFRGRSRADGVRELMAATGLREDAARRVPAEFSGGQRQRIAIARALAVGADLLVCDEVVSALDVSVQAQILNLLMDLAGELALSYLFITHDLAVLRVFADRIVVMYFGRVIEVAPTDVLFRSPKHPYSVLLLTASPAVDSQYGLPAGWADAGEMPDPANPPSGCPFRTRCWRADERCATEIPALRPVGDGSLAACHHPAGPSAEAPAGQGVVGQDHR